MTVDSARRTRASRGTLAGDLLREARQRRGLSQRALAKAAGVSHTSVARIEAGRTQPTLGTLATLLAGAGYKPEVRLVNTARPSELLSQHKHDLMTLARQYGVRSIKVFGSVALGLDSSESDVDLLVEFEPAVRGLDRVEFAQAVEDVLGVGVGIVNPRSASAEFRDRIESSLRDLEDF